MSPQGSPRLWSRVAILAILAALVAFLGWRYGDVLSLETLASREASLLDVSRRNVGLVVAGLFAIYVAVTASSFPAATALTFLTAWLFHRLFGAAPGFLAAVVFVSFASTTGATLAFLLSRYLLRDVIRSRYASRIERFDEALRRDGPFYLFTLRLTPIIPFWLINLAMGLTPIRTRTFWWVSQLGMLPGTLVFVFAGHQVPSLAELEDKGAWDLLWPGPLIALLLLAAFPWIARWAAKALGIGSPAADSASPPVGARAD